MIQDYFKDRKFIQLALVSLMFISFPWNQRINSIFIILLVAHWSFDKNFFEKIKKVKQYLPILLPYFIFFGIHFLFLPLAKNTESAFHTIEVKLSVLILPLIFCTENYFDKKSIQWVFNCFILSAFFSAIYCAVQCYINYFPLYGWPALYHRILFSYIMHPGFYSNFFVVALIYMVLQLLYHKPLKEKFYYIAMVLFFLLILTILISKTSVIVLFPFALSILWHQVNQPRFNKLRYAVFLLAAVCLVFALTKVPNVQKRISETKTELSVTDKNVTFGNSTGSRVAAWSVEWNLIKERWIFGYGTGTANDLLLAKLSEEGYKDLVRYKMHTHNQLLHTWLDLGILGVITLLYFFISCLYYFYKKRNANGFWCALLLLVYSLTDDALEIQIITVFCISVITMFMFQKSEESEATIAI